MLVWHNGYKFTEDMSLPDISNELTGTVQRITYRDEQSLYTVLRLDSPQGVITVVGNFATVAPGEELVLQGEWEFHAVNKLQLA